MSLLIEVRESFATTTIRIPQCCGLYRLMLCTATYIEVPGALSTLKKCSIRVLAHIRRHAGRSSVWALAFKRSTSAASLSVDSQEKKMQLPPVRILCTEDDADTRELLTFVLNRNNCEVITTETPALAIELARAGRFDLYLLDNWIPGMSGADLCSELRSFDTETPILFYSGAGYEKDKTAAYASGAQGYLVKPVDNDELVAEVFRLVSESRANRTTHTTQAAVIKTGQELFQYAAAS
jgi:CheY-like chemotaxis protein